MSPSSLLTSIASRLRSLDASVIPFYLVDLSTEGNQLFKIALCNNYLEDTSAGSRNRRAERKPQASRAKPTHVSVVGSSSDASSGKSSGEGTFTPWNIPSSTRVIQAVESQPADSSFLHDIFKYHLLLTYGNLKAVEYADFIKNRLIDKDWESYLNRAIENEHYVLSLFAQNSGDEREKEEISKMRETVTAAFHTWRSILRMQQ